MKLGQQPKTKYSKMAIKSHHAFKSYEELKTPKSGKVLAYWSLGFMVLLIGILLLPWQQNVEGSGTVAAFNPKNRPQTIQNAIPGKISKWNVVEGQLVKKGDTILVISEIKDDYFDPELNLRLQEQLVAKQQYINATKDQVRFITNQLAALRNGYALTIRKTSNKVIQANNKIKIDSAEKQAENINYGLAEKQFNRYQELYDTKGLISLTELEKRRQTLQEKYAKKISADNKLLNSKNEYLNSKIELGSVKAEYEDKIAKSESERSYKESVLADGENEISKLKNKLANVAVRQEQYHVLAPQTGYLTKTLKMGIGETIKEGEPIATIVPQQSDKSVEMFVQAMDLPLIKLGLPVRVEFDGWPALQFSGWQSASVGTFGGKIAVIDYVANSAGKYRVLVVPDKADETWPEAVRLGSGARGWAMLRFVPVWYELWRQLNGFPPTPVGYALAKTETKDAK